MYIIRCLVLIVFSSFLLFSKGGLTDSNTQLDQMQQLDEDINNTKKPELKRALMQLREDYTIQRKNIRNDYKIKIEPIKKKRDIDLQNLNDNFKLKRMQLFDKYNAKPKKIKVSKKINNSEKKIKKNNKSKKSIIDKN